ncbi:MAG: N-acetylmuramoyl-L-alanine amidase [Akkermansiaceae bacterium]|jgi:N-acetylmuramoyl-L-alanine amidase
MKKARDSLALAAIAITTAISLSCATPPEALPSAKFQRSALKITKALIPEGRYGRRKTRNIRPRYITIHSTQNYGSGADARTHARLLQRGGLKSQNNSLGYLTWHFTVDAKSVYQSLPTNERGQHADYEGKGNRKSVGIEMCEHRGNSRAATLDRTARLTAELMRRYHIPASHVVPHQHWRRIRFSDGKNLGRKNCPHFLMTNGKPGAKWQAFIKLVTSYL